MERRLDILLSQMRPELRDGAYAFCISPAQVDDAIATFIEDEGRTVVIPLQRATALGLEPLFVADWITLTIHSALDAVGFLAEVSARLATAGISCNVFSAVHHDHIFVPHGRGADALSALTRTMTAR